MVVPGVEGDDGLARLLGTAYGEVERRHARGEPSMPTTMRCEVASRVSRTTTTGQDAWRARCWLTEPIRASPAAL